MPKRPLLPTSRENGATTKAEDEGVLEPGVNDVISGRGDTINRHPGNVQFRKLVEEKRRVYLSSHFKREKRMIAQTIVETIQSMDPPGRFLSKDPRTGRWHPITDDRAREKASQALRENSKKIKAELQELQQENSAKDNGGSAYSGGPPLAQQQSHLAYPPPPTWPYHHNPYHYYHHGPPPAYPGSAGYHAPPPHGAPPAGPPPTAYYPYYAAPPPPPPAEPTPYPSRAATMDKLQQSPQMGRTSSAMDKLQQSPRMGRAAMPSPGATMDKLQQSPHMESPQESPCPDRLAFLDQAARMEHPSPGQPQMPSTDELLSAYPTTSRTTCTTTNGLKCRKLDKTMSSPEEPLRKAVKPSLGAGIPPAGSSRATSTASSTTSSLASPTRPFPDSPPVTHHHHHPHHHHHHMVRSGEHHHQGHGGPPPAQTTPKTPVAAMQDIVFDAASFHHPFGDHHPHHHHHPGHSPLSPGVPPPTSTRVPVSPIRAQQPANAAA